MKNVNNIGRIILAVIFMIAGAGIALVGLLVLAGTLFPYLGLDNESSVRPYLIGISLCLLVGGVLIWLGIRFYKPPVNATESMELLGEEFNLATTKFSIVKTILGAVLFILSAITGLVGIAICINAAEPGHEEVTPVVLMISLLLVFGLTAVFIWLGFYLVRGAGRKQRGAGL
ncbi:hypothetical protein ECE50_027370 [Chitinophaga sp. Mgbs1]|uniref:Uncharacterized protein n=1 Tax=Chitinophaga solisilvae TaxID=1233460 RepID=A0A3S1CNB4_9BACT|nr:hypothetical protein [Chitinophaga solisilvae]